MENSPDILAPLAKVSMFKPPIIRGAKIPTEHITLYEVSKIIRGNQFETVTQEANKKYSIYGSKTWKDYKGKENNPYRILKENKLHYVTFGGTFKQRRKDYLITQSGYYCFDLDHLRDIEARREEILAIKDDPYFITNLLFVSPSGEGLKWVVSIAPNAYSYSDNYKGLQRYLKKQYGIKETDNTSDISRACFLCHDNEAYYHGSV